MAASTTVESTNTSDIKEWRSIVVLVVFVLTNLVVLFPFKIPIYVPCAVVNFTRHALSTLRIIPQRQGNAERKTRGSFVRFNFPLNQVTAPLTADLFLLAILAIGRTEVYDGTVGSDHIFPIDIMAFFITLAYIAISIDASGLIRYASFKVLQRGGKSGRRLFFYLYVFFFGLATLIGNDPIVLSGTPFLAYMTRASQNIENPRAWIFTQFAVSNVASAILVSSNPTNLVLAGAFGIKFIQYTANIIVPVLATAIALCPFLLYGVFRSRSLIPASIRRHELSQEVLNKKPVNPNIPFAQAAEGNTDNKQTEERLLEEILNPYLDKTSAWVGAIIMAATLVTILVLNATSKNGGSYPAYWVTCPGAFLMLCWDISYGWINRATTRHIARHGRRNSVVAQREEKRKQSISHPTVSWPASESTRVESFPPAVRSSTSTSAQDGHERALQTITEKPKQDVLGVSEDNLSDVMNPILSEKTTCDITTPEATNNLPPATIIVSRDHAVEPRSNVEFPLAVEGQYPTIPSEPVASVLNDSAIEEDYDLDKGRRERTTLKSLAEEGWAWARETWPTATTVVALLPFPLVPFGLAMFVLVQALVSRGWVAVFAHGWEAWVKATGTVGAVGGMGFLSVVLCNFAGTNIGTTILLCRVIQAWEAIHQQNGDPIAQRTFWAAVYSMALGVNYGAFSTAFSASLAGLLWRDILSRKMIEVKRREFALVNAPIIAFAMVVGCVVLIAEVYIVRNNSPINLSSMD